jgi:CubicO group peptidase (beta-lactamase class C family)
MQFSIRGRYAAPKLPGRVGAAAISSRVRHAGGLDKRHIARGEMTRDHSTAVLTHQSERILSRPAVELMTTNQLTPEQNAIRNTMYQNIVHLSFGQGLHGGWGMGMAVRTHRNGYASIGQFGWDGGTGTTAYADPDKQLTGILLAQVGMSVPDAAPAAHDFWTTLYQAIED